MKKYLRNSLIVSLAAIILAGCAGNSTAAVSGKQDSASQSTEVSAENKILVVYYSATGNTKDAADTIAAALNAETCEIVPTEPYTSDDLVWSNSESRVAKEHEDESLQDVALKSVTVENWSSYTTVFVGYPIWWGEAAWPINNFIKGNDFTGKTVIPFCTSASSGLGSSGTLLAGMAGTGDWQEGKRFSSSDSQDTIASWAESIIN